MMSMFGWIAIGLIVGLLGRLAMPSDDPGGVLVPALIGIVGAILAGLGSHATGLQMQDQITGLAPCVAGAIGMLILYRIVMKMRS